jgi:MSHA biogenesis protein MshJ
MKEQWRRLAAKFDALMVRERALVLIGVVVGVPLLFHTLALQPLEVRKTRLERQILESRNAIKIAETMLRAHDPLSDAEVVKRAYRDALRKQLAEIDQSMQGLQKGLVAPERMAKLLEEMLSRSRGLQLVSLRTLPVQRFEAPAVGPVGRPADKTVRPAAKDPERTVFQHGYEITMQGSYAEVHEYLAQLEKMPWQMFWGRIIVNAEQYPRLRVTLTVQTLSLNKVWLIV